MLPIESPQSTRVIFVFFEILFLESTMRNGASHSNIPNRPSYFFPPIQILPPVQGWDEFLGGFSASFELVSYFLSNSSTLKRIERCWGNVYDSPLTFHFMSV